MRFRTEKLNIEQNGTVIIYKMKKYIVVGHRFMVIFHFSEYFHVNIQFISLASSPDAHSTFL